MLIGDLCVIRLTVGNYGHYLVFIYNYKHLMFICASLYMHSLMGYCLSVGCCVSLFLCGRGVACSVKRNPARVVRHS